jgi:hypothetical protein
MLFLLNTFTGVYRAWLKSTLRSPARQAVASTAFFVCTVVDAGECYNLRLISEA